MKKLLIGWQLAGLIFLIGWLTFSPEMRKSKRAVLGSWRVGSETRKVGDFRRVQLSANGDLHIKVGNKTSLMVEADDNVLPYIESTVVNGTLEFRWVQGAGLYPRRRIKFYLTVTELDGIEAWGEGNVFAPELKSNQL